MEDKELGILKQAFPTMDAEWSSYGDRTVITCNGECGNLGIGIEFSVLWGSNRWSVKCRIREGNYWHEFLESGGNSLESAIANFKSKFSAISDYLLKSQSSTAPLDKPGTD